jgi:hypothetical protein
MGANQSTDNNNKQMTLDHVIDYVAANFILKNNFQDLYNLTKSDYCEKLIILTSKVMDKYLTIEDVTYLKQRMEANVPVNKIEKEKMLYFSKENLNNLNVKVPLTKKRMCIGIAKHYIKIYQVFSSIVKTINPIYNWKDSSGASMSADILNKKNIPSDANTTINKVNLCNTRIKALMNNMTNEEGNITLKPSICKINRKNDNETKNLQDEPGIPELERLYYDVYDYDNGVFSSMSDTMKKQYDEDVKLFYTIFTGNKSKPSEISKFSQILLRDYHNNKLCKTDGLFTKTYKGTIKQNLYKAYIDNINQMMENTKKNQNSLLAIIDALFVFKVNPQDKSKKIVLINPLLTEKELDKIITKTRGLIINLYSQCEKDFYRGLQIFEAIVEKQIKETSISQINNLEKTIENTMQS